MGQKSMTVITEHVNVPVLSVPSMCHPSREIVEHMSFTALIHALNFPEHTQSFVSSVSVAHVIRKSRLKHSLGSTTLHLSSVQDTLLSHVTMYQN